MKIAACVLAGVLSAATPAMAPAQEFTNLDFEGIRFIPPEPPVLDFHFYSWDEAIPGWSHSEGDSTDVVNFLYGHLGYSQNYVLLDRTVAPDGAISGSFAVGMHSGTFYEGEPYGEFVHAFIEQRGFVPQRATTLRMLANNRRFEVTLDGVTIDMRPVGLNPASPTYDLDLLSYVGEWSGDVSSFAGHVANLKILDLDQDVQSPQFLVVDDFRFLPIPEPSSSALMTLGLLACGLVTRVAIRGRGCADPRNRRAARSPLEAIG